MMFKRISILIITLLFIISGIGYGNNNDYTDKVTYGTWVMQAYRDLPDTDMIEQVEIGDDIGVVIHIANPAVYDLVGIATTSITVLTSIKLHIATTSYSAYVLGKTENVETAIKEIYHKQSETTTVIVSELPNKEKIIQVFNGQGNLYFVFVGTITQVTDRVIYQILSSTLNLVARKGI